MRKDDKALIEQLIEQRQYKYSRKRVTIRYDAVVSSFGGDCMLLGLLNKHA